MNVSEFDSPEGADYVSWLVDGGKVMKQYRSTVYAVALESGDGVAVVEPYEGSPDNAVIYNPDGTERVRVTNPFGREGSICFAYVFYVGNELTFVAAFPGMQIACVTDEYGELQRTYETR